MKHSFQEYVGKSVDEIAASVINKRYAGYPNQAEWLIKFVEVHLAVDRLRESAPHFLQDAAEIANLSVQLQRTVIAENRKG